MGKKYEAYVKAAAAETMSKSRLATEDTDQNRRDAEQAELAANDTWNQLKEDPTG